MLSYIFGISVAVCVTTFFLVMAFFCYIELSRENRILKIKLKQEEDYSSLLRKELFDTKKSF